MLRKSVVAVVLSLAWMSLGSHAMAGGYTVYIHNMYNGDYWQGRNWNRTGFSHDLYTSFDACWDSVVDRIYENWYYGTNNEAFMIVWTDARPDAGCFCRPQIPGDYQIYLLTWPSGAHQVYIWYIGWSRWNGPYGY